MSRTTLSSRQEKFKLNPPFIVTMNNLTSNIDISSNLSTNFSISSNLIINNVEDGKSIIYLGTQNYTTGALKTAIIAEGYPDWSRAKLHFCLNNTGNVGEGNRGNSTIYNATVADARMTILYTGNVGIGTNNPKTIMHINGSETNTVLTIMGKGGSGSSSSIDLATYKYTSATNYPNCSLIATDTGSFGATFQINQKTTGAEANAMFTSFFISDSGNVGIGTTNTRCKLEVKGVVGINNGNSYAIANNKMQAGSLTIGDTGLNYGGGSDWTNNTACLMFECLNNTEIAVHDSDNRIASLMYFEGGTVNKITIGRTWSPWTAISSVVLNGNVGIGTNNPGNILQVGDGARLKISNGPTDCTVIGTKDVDDTTNTRIVISGNTRASPYNGNIEYIATSGGHAFYTSAANERMRIANDGLITTAGNISCGGGISLVGANAFYKTTSVTPANITNTFLSFRGSGLGNDWAYLRNIGGDETIKLALDFHDDADDARFCIRSVQSAGAEPDAIAEVFSVNNGDVTCTGNIDCGGGIAITGSSAFWQPNGRNYYNLTVDDANLTNTYINFKAAGSVNDWCYLRQIGGNSTYKLALDFHDDANDARFCIRSVQSFIAADVRDDIIKEVFTVDMGNVGIGNAAPFYPLCIGSVNAVSDGILVLTKRDGGGGARNFKMGYDANFNFQLGDFGAENNANNTWKTQLTISYTDGNVGIGTANQAYKLYVNGTTYIKGSTSGFSAPLVKIEQTAAWDGNYCLQTVGYSDFGGIRINGADTGNSIFKTALTGDMGLTVNNGNMLFNVNGSERMRINSIGNIGIGTNNPFTKLHIEHASTSSAGYSGGLYVYNPNNATSHCSVIGVRIGGSSADKALLSFDAAGTGGWSIYIQGSSVSWLRFNDSWSGTGTDRFIISTSGAIIFNGQIINQYWRFTNEDDWCRLYYRDTNTYFRFAASELWSGGNTTVNGNLSVGGSIGAGSYITAKFKTIANTQRDLLGINFEWTAVGSERSATIFCIHDTFTGFHRCFTEDEKFDINEPQKFKDDYEGRIVISTGKIATDTTYDSNNPNNTEWTILYDKEGITIEDALPQIELSRKKKDKRVFGVIGDPRRNNSRPERLIINSVGEGAILIINSNGNFENGDLITSSDYLGYGEKQDDDLIRNYTVGKITMDCTFQLDCPLYNCYEIEDLDTNGNKLRVAFVACVYYCG